MSDIVFHQFPILSDNYGLLVHSESQNKTALVDAGAADATYTALDEQGWSLDEIWITHHHWDHTQDLVALKEKTGCTVIGPVEKSKSIAGLDRHLDDGDHFFFAGHDVHVISTPGHTVDMINFYMPDMQTVITGDTLFSLGCGRLFEGTPEMMWNSLQKLMALPDDTVIYCSHEYTLSNGHFALSVDPDNHALQQRMQDVERLLANGRPTVPTQLGLEKRTNPFLRPMDPGIRKILDMINASDAQVFKELRSRKDTF